LDSNHRGSYGGHAGHRKSPDRRSAMVTHSSTIYTDTDLLGRTGQRARNIELEISVPPLLNRAATQDEQAYAPKEWTP